MRKWIWGVALLVLFLGVLKTSGVEYVDVCEERIYCSGTPDDRCPAYIAEQTWDQCSPDDYDCCLYNRDDSTSDINASDPAQRCWIDGSCYTAGTNAGDQCCYDTNQADDGPASTSWASCDSFQANDNSAYCYMDSSDACYYCSSDCCDELNGWALADADCIDPGNVKNEGCYKNPEGCDETGCTTPREPPPAGCDYGYGWINTGVECLNDSTNTCYFNDLDPCDTEMGWQYSEDNKCYPAGTRSGSTCYYDKTNIDSDRSNDCAESGCAILPNSSMPASYYVDPSDHCLYSCDVDCTVDGWTRSNCVDDGSRPSENHVCTENGWDSDVEVCDNGLDDDEDGFTDCEDGDCTSCTQCDANGNACSGLGCDADTLDEDTDTGCNCTTENKEVYDASCTNPSAECYDSNRRWGFYPDNEGALCNGDCTTCSGGFCAYDEGSFCDDSLCHTTDYCSDDICYNDPVACSLTSDGCCPPSCTSCDDADCGVVCGDDCTDGGEECDGSADPSYDDTECSNEAPLTACNLTTRRYGTKDSYGDCVGCACSLDDYTWGSPDDSDYCNNCQEEACSDLVQNCGETDVDEGGSCGVCTGDTPPCSDAWSDDSGSCKSGDTCYYCNSNCCQDGLWQYSSVYCPATGTVDSEVCYSGDDTCDQNGCHLTQNPAPASCDYGYGWLGTGVECLDDTNDNCYFNDQDPCDSTSWHYSLDTGCYDPGYDDGTNCYYDANGGGRGNDCTASGGCEGVVADSSQPSTYYESGSHCYYNCNIVCDSGSGWVRSGCTDDGADPGGCVCTSTGWDCTPTTEVDCGNGVDDDDDGQIDCLDSDCTSCTGCGGGNACSGAQCDVQGGPDCSCTTENQGVYDDACSEGPSCYDGLHWGYSPANEGALCGEQCLTCNSGYCDYEEDSFCSDSDPCTVNEQCSADACTSNEPSCGLSDSCCPSSCNSCDDADCSVQCVDSCTDGAEQCDGSTNPVIDDNECPNPADYCDTVNKIFYYYADSYGDCSSCSCVDDIPLEGDYCANCNHCEDLTQNCGETAQDSGGSCDTVCGNDVAEPPVEDCDGADLNGETCGSLGYDSGSLSCDAGCSFNTSDCQLCGNEIIEGTEQCDGSNLNGETCQSQGFGAGTLSCSSCAFDTSSCYTCGNEALEANESCEGTAMPVTNDDECPNPSSYCNYTTQRYWVYDSFGNCDGCMCSEDPASEGDYCTNCDHCNDNVQNCDETGVDLGGNDCQCHLISVSLTSACTGDCKEGEQVQVDATYSGDCPSPAYIQVDAWSEADHRCNISAQIDDPLNQMVGIQAMCTSSANCGVWTVPDLTTVCLGETITPTVAAIYRGGYPGSGGEWNTSLLTPGGSFDFFNGCPIGTTLCTDGSCASSCVASTCDGDTVCEPGEGCTCSDCDTYQDTCEDRLYCELSRGQCWFDGCPDGLRYCKDNICRSDCGAEEVGCVDNGICEIGESCLCIDCDDDLDHCLPDQRLLCDGLTNECQEIPLCGFNETLCQGGFCSNDCGAAYQNCLNDAPNGICEVGEGCTCQDCVDIAVPCVTDLACDPYLELCRYNLTRECQPVPDYMEIHEDDKSEVCNEQHMIAAGTGTEPENYNIEMCEDGMFEDGADMGNVCDSCICCEYAPHQFMVVNVSDSEWGDDYYDGTFYACPINDSDMAYCDKSDDCVYNGICYPKGWQEDIDQDAYSEICDGWAEELEDCFNGVDDDGDSLIDLDDPDCDGYIEGYVTYGLEPLQFARITALGSNRNVSEDLSDALGFFSVRVRGQGVYDAIAEKVGFIPKAQYDIFVAARTTVNINFSLEPTSNICQADCTFNGFCDPACEGIYGCSYPNQEIKNLCAGKLNGFRVRYNETHEVICCNNMPRLLVVVRPDLEVNAKNIVTVRKIVLYDGKLANLVVSVFD